MGYITNLYDDFDMQSKLLRETVHKDVESKIMYLPVVEKLNGGALIFIDVHIFMIL